jgi:hypothetical protein
MFTTVLNKHTYTMIPNLLQASTWGHCPSQHVPLTGHASSHLSSSRLAQASFEPNSYLHIYPSNLVQLFFLFIWPMTMEQIVCSETLAHKIQMPGNHPKERIQHTYTYSHMWTTAEFPIPTALSTKVSYLVLNSYKKSHKTNGVQIQSKHNRQMTSSKFRCCKTCESNGPSIFEWVTHLVQYIYPSWRWPLNTFFRALIFKNKKLEHLTFMWWGKEDKIFNTSSNEKKT